MLIVESIREKARDFMSAKPNRHYCRKFYSKVKNKGNFGEEGYLIPVRTRAPILRELNRSGCYLMGYCELSYAFSSALLRLTGLGQAKQGHSNPGGRRGALEQRLIEIYILTAEYLTNFQVADKKCRHYNQQRHPDKLTMKCSK